MATLQKTPKENLERPQGFMQQTRQKFELCDKCPDKNCIQKKLKLTDISKETYNSSKKNKPDFDIEINKTFKVFGPESPKEKIVLGNLIPPETQKEIDEKVKENLQKISPEDLFTAFITAFKPISTVEETAYNDIIVKKDGIIQKRLLEAKHKAEIIQYILALALTS